MFRFFHPSSFPSYHYRPEKPSCSSESFKMAHSFSSFRQKFIQHRTGPASHQREQRKIGKDNNAKERAEMEDRGYDKQWVSCLIFYCYSFLSFFSLVSFVLHRSFDHLFGHHLVCQQRRTKKWPTALGPLVETAVTCRQRVTTVPS